MLRTQPVLTPAELNVCEVLLPESLVGCWIWHKSKQRMHFTPMRASISTIGPPYGTEAPPPRSIPAEGLIHASRQRFTASFPALGSTVLIRSGLLTKEGLLLTHLFFKKTKNKKQNLSLNCLRSWAPSRWTFCARPDAGDFFFFCAWTMLVISGGIHLLPSFLA